MRSNGCCYTIPRISYIILVYSTTIFGAIKRINQNGNFSGFIITAKAHQIDMVAVTYLFLIRNIHPYRDYKKNQLTQQQFEKGKKT